MAGITGLEPVTLQPYRMSSPFRHYALFTQICTDIIPGSVLPANLRFGPPFTLLFSELFKCAVSSFLCAFRLISYVLLSTWCSNHPANDLVTETMSVRFRSLVLRAAVLDMRIELIFQDRKSCVLTDRRIGLTLMAKFTPRQLVVQRY